MNREKEAAVLLLAKLVESIRRCEELQANSEAIIAECQAAVRMSTAAMAELKKFLVVQHQVENN